LIIAVASRRKRSFTTSSLEHLEDHIYDVIPEKRASFSINFGSEVSHYIPESQEEYKDIDRLYEKGIGCEM
jgi:hypothetical protein